jgi:hypothetical protein
MLTDQVTRRDLDALQVMPEGDLADLRRAVEGLPRLLEACDLALAALTTEWEDESTGERAVAALRGALARTRGTDL